MDSFSRRLFLQRGIVGGSAAIFQSLATGIPMAWFLNPHQAYANSLKNQRKNEEKDQSVYTPQFLIFSTSSSGDPMMCNTPGTYMDSNISHSPNWTAGSMQVGGESYQAATPWTTLPNSTLNNTAFFYFSTRTVVHGEEPDVLKLMGASKNGEMLVSSIASSMQSKLNTIQTAPVTLGTTDANESIVFLGSPQPRLTPLGIKTILINPNNSLVKLQSLRDQSLKELCSYLRRSGNPGQVRAIDQYVNSQNQARALSQNVLQSLANIQDNLINSQINAAIILIQLRYTPVVTIHMDFGGDNHNDVNFANEILKTTQSIGALNNMTQQLSAANLSNQVTFAALNVFGRTMSNQHNFQNTQKFGNVLIGRDHNGDTAGSVVIGANIRGGVIGGVAQAPASSTGNQMDYACLPINSQSGQGSLSGDITLATSLPSFGKTLATAAGVDPSDVNTAITSGVPITGALKTS